MKQRKAYKGYKSTSILMMRIIPISNWLKSSIAWNRMSFHCSVEEEERFERIMKEGYNINLHEHPTIIPEDLSELMAYEREGREFTGYEALSYSYWDAILTIAWMVPVL